jgi:hypothetical protein
MMVLLLLCASQLRGLFAALEAVKVNRLAYMPQHCPCRYLSVVSVVHFIHLSVHASVCTSFAWSSTMVYAIVYATIHPATNRK